MPPIVAAAAIGAGASLLASRSAQSAQRDASRMEEKSLNLALTDAREERDYSRRRADDDRAFDRGRYAEERDYDRGQTSQYLERLQPYAKPGARAITDLGAMTSRVLPSTVPTNGSGGMVRIQAPNGQVREVPEAHAAHYLSKGGVRV